MSDTSIKIAKLSDWSGPLSDTIGFSGVYQQSAGNDGLGIARYAGSIIGALIVLLGVLLLAEVVLAGYEWLTSEGDSGKIKSAQNRIKYAIIGVIVIVSLYAISAFVFRVVGDSTGYQLQ